MCDLCDGTTFCQLNVCSDCKSNIDNMEQNFNSLQQLKAKINSEYIENMMDKIDDAKKRGAYNDLSVLAYQLINIVAEFTSAI